MNLNANCVNQIKTVIIKLFLSVSVDVSDVDTDEKQNSENRGPSFPQTEGKCDFVLSFVCKIIAKKLLLSILN